MSLLTDASLLLTPNANATSKLYSIIPSNGNGDFTGTRATTATRVNSSGLIETAAINMIRRDYSLGGCPNILLEPQRTNLALQSSSFDNATWGKTNTTATANTAISPSGIMDADTYTANGSSSVKQIFATLLLSASTNYTLSIYAKKNTNNFIQLLSSSQALGGSFYANFDLQNGVIGQYTGTLSAPKITDVGNGWYRCEASVVSVASPINSAAISISLITSATSPRAETNTLNTSVFLWGVQLEAGAYATSYIPTTTASVTRNVDVITRNNVFTNNLITASGGTWFIELRNNIALTRDGGGNSVIFLGDSSTPTTGNCFRLWSGTSSRFIVQKVVASIATQLFVTTANTCKLAIKWNGTTADIFQNGVKVVSATAFTATALENLFGGGAQTTAYVNEMALFPTPLTDAQCLALTA